MRRVLALYVAVVFGLIASVWAQAQVTTTTTEAMSYSGTFTEIDPGRSVIVLHSESTPTPSTYSITERTTFVDEAGNTVSRETIRNRPVTVYYTRHGDATVVDRVVVTKPGARVIERYQETIERHYR